MNEITPAVTYAARLLLEAAVNSIWQSSLLALVVWVAFMGHRRLNAVTRFWIGWAALVAVVALPIFHALMFAGPSQATLATARPSQTPILSAPSLPPAQTAGPVLAPSPDTTPVIIPALPSFSPPQRALTSILPMVDSTPPQSGKLHRPVLRVPSGFWVTAAVLAWFGCTGWLLFRLLNSCRFLLQLKRGSHPLDAGRQEKIDQWMQFVPVRREVMVRSSDQIGSPVAIGFFRPVILLPEGLLADISNAELRQVVWHEMAHLRRGDDWTNLLQQVALALCCFNPVAWWLESRLRLEREIACDDSVLRATGEPKAYARCLTHLAEMSQVSSGRMAPGMMMVRSQLARRINLLLDRKRNISARPCGWQLSLGLATAVAVVMISARGPLLISVATGATQRQDSQSNSAATGAPLEPGGQGPSRNNGEVVPLPELERRFNTASAGRIRLETEYQRAQSSGDDIPSLLALPTIAKDPSVANCLAQLAQQEVEVSTVKNRYLPRHPKYAPAMSKLAEWQQRLTNATLQAARSLATAYGTAKQAEEFLQARITAQTLEAPSTQSTAAARAAEAGAKVLHEHQQRFAAADDSFLAASQAQAEAQRRGDVAVGAPAAPPGVRKADDPRSEKRELLLQELKLVEEQLAIDETRVKRAPSEQQAGIRARIFDLKRDLLSLKRTLLDLGVAVNVPADPESEKKAQATAREDSAERERERAETTRRTEAVNQQMLKSFLEIARSDADATVRLSAVEAIGRLSTDAAIEPLAEIVTQDPDETVRVNAVLALGRGNAASLEAALRLYDRLDKSDFKLKLRVIEQFAQNKVISQVYYSSSTGTMNTNLVSQRQVAAEAVPKLTRIAREDPLLQIRNIAIQKIGTLQSDETTRVLIALYDDCQNTECKNNIIQLLGQRPSPEAADKLFAIARSDPEPIARQIAVKNLSALSSSSGSYSNLVVPSMIKPSPKDGGGAKPKPEAKLEKRFTILGQVQRPGRFTSGADDELTLLEAVATAGGWTRLANAKRVKVLRMHDGKQVIFEVDVDRMAKGTTKVFEILDQDVITVPEKIF